MAKYPRPDGQQRDDLPSENVMVINMLLSFLFHEHRDKIYTRAFFMKMFNKDFQVSFFSSVAGLRRKDKPGSQGLCRASLQRRSWARSSWA